VGTHVWLPPFAHADPPDPLWIGGYFDDADDDDVVLLVMAMTSVVNTRPLFEVPVASRVVLVVVPEPPCPPSAPAPTQPIRAPPAA
jgi:hypothetical protein